MSEIYRVTAKRKTGISEIEVVKDFSKKEESSAYMKELYGEGFAEDDVKLEIKEDGTGTPEEVERFQRIAKPPRKPRADKGQPRTKKPPVPVPEKDKGAGRDIPGAMNSAEEIADSLGLPKPDKKKRRSRGMYFVVTTSGESKGIISRWKTSQELFQSLDDNNEVVVVIQGRELKPVRKVQYSLNPI